MYPNLLNIGTIFIATYAAKAVKIKSPDMHSTKPLKNAKYSDIGCPRYKL